MNRCKINLGRDWIMPVGTRRKIYHIMHVYLVASVFFLAFAFYDAAMNFRRAVEYRDSALSIRRQITNVPGESRSLLNYAEQLRTRIETCTQQAQAVCSALPGDIHTVLPLLNFLLSRPDGSDLVKLTSGIQDKEKSKLPAVEFSLAVPVDGRQGSSPAFIQNWRRNTDLSDLFASITPVTTRSGNGKDGDRLVVNYRAVFKE